uniref:Reverse transcriptase domain-containing protein n=1 Tax=Cannabis sativa TaxID=3483 RepID=A0A803PR23_CANSA
MVCGDLNAILSGDEKHGGQEYSSREGKLLQEFMIDTGGVDLGFIGPKFTWRKSRGAQDAVRKRLDCAVASADWCILFPEAKVFHYPILASDHAPLIVDLQPMEKKPAYPFRFLEVWSSNTECEEVVRSSWEKPCFGQPSYRVCKKLMVTKQALKCWNRNVFGMCNVQLKGLYERLNILQQQLSQEACLEEAEIQLEILDKEHKMERIWKQKSRELWVKHGDCNSKFFHTATMVRRRRNRINAINEDGSIGSSIEVTLGTISSENSKICLRANNQLSQEFFLHGKFVEKMNHTFICLIPKCDSPAAFDQFRPISLCNFSYKIISRLITDRLKPILDKLISPYQSAFLPGRWIAECSVLAAEAAHTMNKIRSRKGFMAVKTDMHKAYDRIEWSFLHRVLMANGFNEHFCKLIMQCVTTLSFSILLNGAPLPPFAPSRGLRQGDPLSPYLFILCSEVLSKLVLRAESRKRISGLKIGKKANPITHLFYADDAIFYCKAFVTEAEQLGICIDTYERWSGQLVNRRKSGIVFSPKTNVGEKNLIHERLEIQLLDKREKYLGNPFFTSGSRRDDCNFLIEKMLQRLEGWKAKHLSFAGRQTLISSVLHSIPCYAMSTTQIPISTCAEMDRIVARFWWKGASRQGDSNRYLALKSWTECCQPKAHGGLGFRRFKDINMALLAKLAWFLLDNNTCEKPWVNVLKAKYCSVEDFWSVQGKVDDSRGWRGILASRTLCANEAGFLIGTGEIDIWTKPWVPGFSPMEKGSNKGKFSVKSAYWSAQHHRFKEAKEVWKHLWKARIHSSLKTLCWRIFSGCLPTKMRLAFSDDRDKLYSLCGEEIETEIHLFRDCHFARCLWFTSPGGIRSSLLCTLSLEDLFVWLAKANNDRMVLYGACIFERIWRCRNEVIFRGASPNVDTSIRIIKQRVMEFSGGVMENGEPNVVDLAIDRLQETRWDIQFWVDASVVQGAAGTGAIQVAVAEDEVVVLLQHLTVESVLEAEFHAIWSVLSWAKEKNIDHVLIESDSQIAVKAIGSRQLPYAWGSFPLFHACCSLISGFKGCVVSFIPRAENSLADKLACFARMSSASVCGLLREVAPFVAAE